MPSNGAAGVSNLRALFENKASDDQSGSPPSRGRSPAPSDASSSRHVSKVRASFVTVERPGDVVDGQIWGLRKVSDASMANNKTQTRSKMGDAAKVKSEPRAQPEKAQLNGTPTRGLAHGGDMIGGLGNILKGSPFVEAGLPKSHDQDSRPKPPAFNRSVSGKANGKIPTSANPKSIVEKVKESIQANRNQPPPKEKLVTTKEGRAIKPPPTRQKVPSKPAAKAPISPKTVKAPTPVEEKTSKGTSAKAPVVDDTIAEPVKEDIAAAKALTPPPAEQAAPEPAVPESVEATSESEQPSTESQSLKSQPTALKTAASRAKTPPTNRRVSTKTTRLPTFSASTSTRPPPTSAPVRASTVSKRPPPKTAVPTSKRLPRASLPAQLTPKPNTKTRATATGKAPSEGFLARMMRPTASSAQKTHEKVGGGSPPRAARAASVVEEE